MLKKIKALRAIGKEMCVQNNRATQNPLFVIQIDQEYCVPADQADAFKRKNLDDLKPADLCESCLEKFRNDEPLPEECDNCDESCFYFYSVLQQFDLRAGVFFTAKACEDHIRRNHYHYNNPKCYGIGAWRNPEMQTVQQALTILGGLKVPAHYK